MTINVISGIVYFREIILESSQNASETTPRLVKMQMNFDTNYTEININGDITALGGMQGTPCICPAQ